jgi:hypothetical protein
MILFVQFRRFLEPKSVFPGDAGIFAESELLLERSIELMSHVELPVPFLHDQTSRPPNISSFATAATPAWHPLQIRSGEGWIPTPSCKGGRIGRMPATENRTQRSNQRI